MQHRSVQKQGKNNPGLIRLIEVTDVVLHTPYKSLSIAEAIRVGPFYKAAVLRI